MCLCRWRQPSSAGLCIAERKFIYDRRCVTYVAGQKLIKSQRQIVLIPSAFNSADGIMLKVAGQKCRLLLNARQLLHVFKGNKTEFSV
jgi:hypothetical protein